MKTKPTQYATPLLLASALSPLFGPLAHAETTLLLSATSQGVPGNAISDRPSISADGRYIAFQSAATNLISSDTNAHTDIFLLDRQSGVMSRVSKGTLGTESNGESQAAAISAAGRYIAFESTATNLVSSDSNAVQDVFVYDATGGTTTRVSVHTDGTPGNGESFKPQLSSDGRFVAFMSYSTTLVTGDTNSVSDVFLHDRNDGTTVRASVDSSGSPLTVASDFPSISADGNYVAFSSGNFVYVYDRLSGTTQNIAASSNGTSSFTSLSSDGRYVAFSSAATNLVAGDTNAVKDVFVYDRTLTTTTRASVSQNGAQSIYDGISPVLSADGRYVAFVTLTGPLSTRVGRTSVTFDAISAATGGGGGGSTTTTNYVWRRDLTQNITVRAGSAYGGSVPNASSGYAAMSSDGTLVAFSSLATNLTCTTDSNAVADVYLRDLRSSTATPSCGGTQSTAKAAGGTLGWSLLILLGAGIARRMRARRCLHQ